MEGEAAEPDHEDKPDEEVLVGAPHLLRPAQQQQERDKRRQQKGGIARAVDRLGEERFAPPPLAIKEHALAQAHGAPPPSARKARWPPKVPCLPPFNSSPRVLCSTRNRASGGNRAMKAVNTVAIATGVVALGVSVLGGPANAERWRQAVTDPRLSSRYRAERVISFRD